MYRDSTTHQSRQYYGPTSEIAPPALGYQQPTSQPTEQVYNSSIQGGYAQPNHTQPSSGYQQQTLAIYRIRPHTRSQFRSQPQPGHASSAQYATQPADPYYGRGNQLSISSILCIPDLSDNSPVPPGGPYDNSDPYDRGVILRQPRAPPVAESSLH